MGRIKTLHGLAPKGKAGRDAMQKWRRQNKARLSDYARTLSSKKTRNKIHRLKAELGYTQPTPRPAVESLGDILAAAGVSA